MKKKSILLIFIFLVQTISFNWACINEFTGKNAHNIEQNYGNEEVITFLQQFPIGKGVLVDYDKKEKELLNKLPEKMENISKEEMQVWSDFAVALIRNSFDKNEKLTQAIEILEKMLLQFPDEYALHANIGTAFELQGNNEKALFHIKKSIEINPDSHRGSEWIHIKILKGKISFAKNPNFFMENPNWLGISFENGKMIFLDKNIEEHIKELVNNYNPEKIHPSQAIISKNKTAEILLQHIIHQLGERMFFVFPKDVWVGEALKLLGDILVNEFDVKIGLNAYKRAKLYSVSNDDLLEKRIKNAEELIKKQENEPYKIQNKNNFEKTTPKTTQQTQSTSYIYAVILAFLALSFVVFWFFRRKKR